MKHLAFALAFVLTAAPAYAQLGGLGRKLGKAKDAKEKVDKVRELNITEKQEREIGEKVSERVRQEFGVYQDEDVTKYVTLVGTVMAQASSRPDLKWEFIVLDTDGVNAFASPGGLVHVTRGALGLIKSEAELAGVLAHEIAHVVERHTVNAIRKNRSFEIAADVAPGSSAYLETAANAFYDSIVEKGFDRGDEEDADKEGARLANKVGYDPAGLNAFLGKLIERNKEMNLEERNGMFASHPETQGRIARLGTQIKSEKLNAQATVQARYAEHITFDAKPLSEISALIAGTRGVAGSAEAKGNEEKAGEKKDGGRKLGIGALNLSKGAQAESTQASASAGNRAVTPDRAAPGGPNSSKLAVPITAAEIEAFKKGIAS